MTYNIIGVFPTIEAAIKADRKLNKAGFSREFRGFIINTNFQPESLVEDHFIDQNEITVYTPNVNRAHKAKNILLNFGEEIKNATGITFEKAQQLKLKNSLLLSYKSKKTEKKSYS